MADFDRFSGLSPRQRAYVEALSAGAPFPLAAAAAGVTVRTGRRYRQDPRVIGALRQATDDALADAARALARGATDALGVLSDVMVDTEVAESVRVQAAKAWLDYSLRAYEVVDVSERLAELERILGV